MISPLDLEKLPGAVAEVELLGRRLRLTNLDKVLWPRTTTTKRHLLDYYVKISPVLLPHLRNRPLTLGRYPDGVEGVNWFQTSCPHPPDWLRTHVVRGARSGGRRHCVVEDLAGLLWVVNLGSIELHPLLSVAARPSTPTALVFDLDPGPGTSLAACCEVALGIRSLLASLQIDCVATTSGVAGLHVYVPLNSEVTYADTKKFARSVARRLAEECSDLVVDRMEADRRIGRVFVDWSQNDPSKSTVAPYSLRAMPWPAAATPLTWAEVEQMAGGSPPLGFEAREVLHRVAEQGDLFSSLLDLRQQLP